MTHLTRRGFTGGAMAAGLAPGLARAQTLAEWNKVIEAAKAEGKVVVYSAYISPLTHNAIAAAFEKKYGIKIDYWTARGVELRERARIEQTTSRYIGDVMHNAIVNTDLAYNVDKTIQPHGGIPSAAKLSPVFKARANDYEVPAFTINYGFLVNTAQVKTENEPKGWLDLLDPKWSGKILSDDPRASGGGAVMFRMLFAKFGREYLEKLAAQKLVFARDYQESSRRVARGEFLIYIPYIFSDFPNLKGLPVKYVVPAEGVTYGSYSVGVIKNAPHPNAARLLVDFYLSDEVQAIYAQTGHGATVANLDVRLPPELQGLAGMKVIGPEDFSNIDGMYAEAEKIFGKP